MSRPPPQRLLAYIKNGPDKPKPAPAGPSLPKVHGKAKYSDRPIITSLPNEILALIFEVGHASKSKPSRRITVPAARLPFNILVSQVTRHWRNIALDLPHLWSRIDVSPWLPEELLLEFLRRTKTGPVDLCINTFRRSASEELNVEGMLRPIIPQADRWRSLSIITDPFVALEIIFSQLQTVSVPRLESLQLSFLVCTEERPDVGMTPRIFSGGTPSLRSVELTCIGPSFFLPPLVTVTKLELCYRFTAKSLYIDFDEFTGMLKGLSSLAHLSIHGNVIDTWPGIDVSTIGPIVLPSLRTLWICGHGTHGLPVAIPLFIIAAPLLESITLEVLSSEHFKFSLNSLIAPRFPLVRSLTWKNVRFDMPTYEYFMQAFPSVTHFTLIPHKHIVPLHLFGTPPSSRSIRTGVAPRWPDLQSFAIESARVDVGSLCSMVSTRISVGSPLAKIRLGSKVLPRVLPEQMAWLSERIEIEEALDLSDAVDSDSMVWLL